MLSLIQLRPSRSEERRPDETNPVLTHRGTIHLLLACHFEPSECIECIFYRFWACTSPSRYAAFALLVPTLRLLAWVRLGMPYWKCQTGMHASVDEMRNFAPPIRKDVDRCVSSGIDRSAISPGLRTLAATPSFLGIVKVSPQRSLSLQIAPLQFARQVVRCPPG